MDEAWAGIDAGKEFHWAHVLDAAGRELLSPKLENNEADISEFIEEVLSLAEAAVWAVDQPGGGGAALLLALRLLRKVSSSPSRTPPYLYLCCPDSYPG